jgi:hypothetical protein
MQFLKVLRRIVVFGKLRIRTLLAVALAFAGTVAVAQQTDYSYSLRIVNANAPFYTEVTDIETMQPGDRAWLRLEVASEGGVSHGEVQLVGPLPAPLQVGSMFESSSTCTFYLYGSQEGDTAFSMGFIQWDNQPSCLMYVPIVWPADVPCSVPRTLTINASKDDPNNPVVASDSVSCNAVSASLSVNINTSGGPSSFSADFPLMLACTKDGVDVSAGITPASPVTVAAGSVPGAVTFEGVPVGAECTATQTQPTAPAGYHWTAAPEPAVLIVASAVAENTVTLNNPLAADVVPLNPGTATAVPTLGEWGAALMALMLAALGFTQLRRIRK